ncbi:hypothetical protein BKD02_12880 [Brucella sp. 09RB8910]|nr:hypothetical protein BKD02_12880 [Brucella sp. 09RB8910]
MTERISSRESQNLRQSHNRDFHDDLHEQILGHLGHEKALLTNPIFMRRFKWGRGQQYIRRRRIGRKRTGPALLLLALVADLCADLGGATDALSLC